MPLYKYECEKCGETQDVFHPMSKEPKVSCEHCKGKCFRVIQPVQGYVRGNCYLNKKDCKKQATLSTLKESDPYKRYRQPGEAEDLANKLKNADKNKKTFGFDG